MNRKRYSFFHVLVQKIDSSRFGAWFYARTLHHFDHVAFKLSGGRATLTSALAGLAVVLLTTTGAKSGLPRTLPLLCIRDERSPSTFALQPRRGGDFSALLALLDPDIVLRADSVAVQMGASAEIRGAAEVAKIFSGRARAAQVALIEGVTGLIWAQRGQPRVAFSFAITNGKIVTIDLTADPERLRQLDWKGLND